MAAHHGLCTTYVVGGPLMDHLWQIYKQVIYKVIKWRKDWLSKMKEYRISLLKNDINLC